MAISNVYKPGWRSRRRSRLSLVERSVSRHGHVPALENISKPETPSTLAPSRDADVDQQEETDPDLDPRAPLELTGRQPEQAPDSSTGQLPLPSLRHAQEFERVPEDIDGQLAPRLGGNVEPEISMDDEVELGAESRTVEEAPLSNRLSTQGMPEREMPTPRVVIDAEEDAAETSDSLVLPKVLEDSWDIEGMSAVVQAGAEPGEVQLDWSTLIPSGLVDPRDRARPLPANVDDIARALIRQALSDQSSWRDRIILVSSARESRAKSMAALNFAFALTTIDRHSVVLLDANMDGSGVGGHLKATGHSGLTTALCDSTVEVDEITLKTNLDRLTLVGSGGFEDDILDRFASRRMLEVLRFLTKDPDTLLVLDAPPILSSQEATVLSVIAGQVVLVVEAGATDENSINHALKRIGDRHNVSLVLSHSSGIGADEPKTLETPAGRRLALPKPKPKISMSKRRLRRAVASIIVGVGFGLSVLLGTGLLSADQAREEGSSQELSQHGKNFSSSIFEIKPIAPQIGSVAR